jgi:hypothetical protein
MPGLTSYLAILFMALVPLSHAAPRPEQSSSFTSAAVPSALLTREVDPHMLELEIERFRRMTEWMMNKWQMIGIPPAARTDVDHDPNVVLDVYPFELRLLLPSYNSSSQADEMVLLLEDEIVHQCGVTPEMFPEWIFMTRCPEDREELFNSYIKKVRTYGLQLAVPANVLRKAKPTLLGDFRCVRGACQPMAKRQASVTITEVLEALPTTTFVPSRFSLGAPEATQTPSASHQEGSILDMRPSPSTNAAATLTQPSTLITAMSKTIGDSDFLDSMEGEQAAHGLVPRVEIDAPMECIPPPKTWKVTYNSWISFTFYTLPWNPRRRGPKTRSPPPTGPWTPPWVTNSKFATAACRSVWAEAFNGLAGTSSTKVYTVEW